MSKRNILLVLNKLTFKICLENGKRNLLSDKICYFILLGGSNTGCLN